MSTYTAQTYSIDTILKMKQVYTEMPYPGFNLFDICRKKSAAGVQRLTKGENAWVVSKPKTSDQVLKKTVRGLLNKLTPEKYDEVFADADLSMLLEESAIETVIELIFEKALQEPAYSKIYSRFCHDVAMFEVNMTPVSPGDGPKSKRSEFRNKIVSRAQREFERVSDVEEELDAQAQEAANAAQAKRKRANIKFVGQLYLQKVISQRTMHMIIRGIFRTNDSKPGEIDIEVLTELLETIGKSIDETQDGYLAMDDHFEELKDLLKRIDGKQLKIGPRVRFRILDTIELRANNWVHRVKSKQAITPATFSEAERKLTTPVTMGIGLRSPTACTPNRRSAPRFPESPAPPKNPAWRGDVPAAVTGSNPATPSSSVFPNRNPSPQPSGAAASPTAFSVSKPTPKLAARIQAGRREWKENGQELDFVHYQSQLTSGTYPGVTEDNVKDVVAHEIIKEACTTSRAEAQDDACKFLITGVGIGKIPLVTAFAGVIQQAIDEGSAEDVPLFYARIVKIMKSCSGSDESIDVYRDAIIATFNAFDQLSASSGATPTTSTSPASSPTTSGNAGFPTGGSGILGGILDMTEDYIEEVLKVWRLLPQSDLDGEKVVTAIFERGTNGNAPTGQLVAAVLEHLIGASLCTADDVKKWIASPKGDAAPELKKTVSEKLNL